MSTTMSDASQLVEEYDILVEESGWSRTPESRSLERLRASLIETAEWTPVAAEALVQLAKKYGSFMLRNALALAIALNIEDGDAGY